MLNQKSSSSLVAALLDRARSLDAKCEQISYELQHTDRDFTRLRLEVIGRQALDTWTSYYRQIERNEQIHARFDAMEAAHEAEQDYFLTAHYAQAML